MKKNKLLLILLILITSVTIYSMIPLLKNTNYGLDLKGGFEVLYQVKTIDGKELTNEMVMNTYKTILKRIDVLGVAEPNITIEGKDKIRIQLAGIKNADDARKLLSTTANLTFRDINDNLILNSDVLKSGGATVSSDNMGNPAVGLSIKNKDAFFTGTSLISKMENGTNIMVIWLDFNEGVDSFENEKLTCGEPGSNCLSSATVAQAFSSDVIIQGNFTKSEVNNLVELINSGSLPTKLTEISSKTVDASFGEDSLNMTFKAGVIGIIGIMLIMIILYHFAGIITAISILFYSFLVFLLFYLIGGVLTLPGIAALVIGIGMAVDANVITFARIKDELYQGRTLKTSFINGNKQAFATILDANLTTLLVAIILFIFGESAIKGFATMFIISILVTIFVMFFITKFILKIFVESKFFDSKINLFINAKEKYIPNIKKNEKTTYQPFKNLDLVKRRKTFYIISLIIILLGLAFTIKDGFNLGIDYKGGSNVTIMTDKNINIKEEINSLKLTYVGEQKTKIGYEIRIENELNEDEVISTSNYFKEKYEATTDISVVSNIVKRELTKNAIISIILASIGIVLYVTIRYRFSYAISALIALIHDVLIIIGIFSILRIEINSIFIAAILAIIGYSINDTIICFDRIRETLNNEDELKDKEHLKDVINNSFKTILNRSIITSLTTIVPVITLIIFGSPEIEAFNFALLIGLIAGTYSSIFIAAQIWYDIEKNKIGINKDKKSRWHDLIDHDEVQELKIKGIND